jgi:hypothetical protein
MPSFACEERQREDAGRCSVCRFYVKKMSVGREVSWS